MYVIMDDSTGEILEAHLWDVDLDGNDKYLFFPAGGLTESDIDSHLEEWDVGNTMFDDDQGVQRAREKIREGRRVDIYIPNLRNQPGIIHRIGKYRVGYIDVGMDAEEMLCRLGRQY
jgi:hypothetical protein